MVIGPVCAATFVRAKATIAAARDDDYYGFTDWLGLFTVLALIGILVAPAALAMLLIWLFPYGAADWRAARATLRTRADTERQTVR